MFEAEAVAAAANEWIAARRGCRPTTILRNADAWRAMVDANPFVAAGHDRDRLHVACLARAHDGQDGAWLDPESSAPDEFVAADGDVYLRLPNGVAKANLTNTRLDKAFRTVSTLRNWRAVLRLLERLGS